jgi:hypothetical protein
VIDGYIVDFYCAQLRLALEVDGPIHDEPKVAARDAIRDGHLADWAVDVVRIGNEEATPERLRELLAPYAKRLRGARPHPRPLSHAQQSHIEGTRGSRRGGVERFGGEVNDLLYARLSCLCAQLRTE